MIDQEAREALSAEIADKVEDDLASEASLKRPKKKARIIVGIIAAVIAVAGIGMFVWHEQPSFCGAICHTPMDAYYETYADGSADKYGNELDTAGSLSMMANLHGKLNYGCLDCHQPTLGQQINEGIAWVTGGYEIAGENKQGMTYMETRDLKNLMEVTGKQDYEMCLNDACHAGVTMDNLESATAELSEERNPHSFQHGTPTCGNCHQAHAQSVNTCTQCHNDAPVPAGWLTVSEAKELQA